MHYEDDDFTDPWRSSETVLIHHGNSRNLRLWYAWVPLLARDYRVVRLDARGFGESSKPEPGYAWSVAGLATDVRNLLDHLGIEKVHWIGEAIGGTIGLQFAHDSPQRVRTVTTFGSPFRFADDEPFWNFYRVVHEQGLEHWARNTFRFEEPGRGEWMINEVLKTDTRLMFETIEALSTQDLTDVLRAVSTPTLVLLAEQTTEADRARNVRIAETVQDGRVAYVPGAARMLPYLAPEACVAAWRDFLRSVSG
jgi:pimeloyl-ACP methyl ester carboxylesterase